jgi:hypothetical protein
MIEALQEMPPGVTGVRVSGRVSGEELREFRPTWAKLVEADQVRFVEVIDDDYWGFGPGGLIEDWKMSWGSLLGHHSALSASRSSPTRNGSSTRSMRWHGWCPARSRCSLLMTLTVPSAWPPPTESHSPSIHLRPCWVFGLFTVRRATATMGT